MRASPRLSDLRMAHMSRGGLGEGAGRSDPARSAKLGEGRLA